MRTSRKASNPKTTTTTTNDVRVSNNKRKEKRTKQDEQDYMYVFLDLLCSFERAHWVSEDCAKARPTGKRGQEGQFGRRHESIQSIRRRFNRWISPFPFDRLCFSPFPTRRAPLRRPMLKNLKFGSVSIFD
jgi:hypothetical protein